MHREELNLEFMALMRKVPKPITGMSEYFIRIEEIMKNFYSLPQEEAIEHYFLWCDLLDHPDEFLASLEGADISPDEMKMAQEVGDFLNKRGGDYVIIS